MGNYTNKLNLETERYRAELSKITNEHLIIFSRLHAERASVIKIFYAKLVSLNNLLQSFLCPVRYPNEPSLTDNYKDILSKYNDITRYFLKNKILFSKDLCITIEKILRYTKSICNDVSAYPIEWDDSIFDSHPNLVKEKRDMLNESRTKVDKEINTAKQLLEDNFRKLLGVS